MTKRTVLATATLAALPIFTATTYQAPSHSGTLTAQTHILRLTETPNEPHWGALWGMEGGEALLFGFAGLIECSFFGPVGSFACGATGLL